jgi:serine/threonine-protein kinase
MSDTFGKPPGGTLNGKYVLEQMLGQGGMAEVFLAKTIGVEGFSRQVAIKRVLREHAQNPVFSNFFVTEAKLTSKLQHHNLISVLDFDRDADGRLFLVMEFVDGIDLSALLATGPLSIPLVLYLAAEILVGLDYVHDLPITADGARGLVHRDISPNNVLLSWAGAVKVSDFGIAKARDKTVATASTVVKGKVQYMSPEQANGRDLDGRSDLFAVGIMLYEMLSLQSLFAGDTQEETLSRLYFATIPEIRTVRRDCPKDLAHVVSELLVRDLQKRTQSAKAAYAALMRCADYPKNGRELLTALLSERCPGRARVRARDVPSASATAATRVPQIEMPHVRDLRTATAPLTLRPDARRRRLWIVAISVVAGAALAVAGLVIRDSLGSATAPPSLAAPGSQALPVTSPVVPPPPLTRGEGTPAASSPPTDTVGDVARAGSGAALPQAGDSAPSAVVDGSGSRGRAIAPAGAAPRPDAPAERASTSAAKPPVRRPSAGNSQADGIRQIKL